MLGTPLLARKRAPVPAGKTPPSLIYFTTFQEGCALSKRCICGSREDLAKPINKHKIQECNIRKAQKAPAAAGKTSPSSIISYSPILSHSSMFDDCPPSSSIVPWCTNPLQVACVPRLILQEPWGQIWQIYANIGRYEKMRKNIGEHMKI